LVCSLKVMSKHRRVIKVERHSFLTVRPVHSPINLWCDECNMTVAMVTPERAALLTHTTPRMIYRKVENNELHFVETIEGELFVCYRCLQVT